MLARPALRQVSKLRTLAVSRARRQSDWHTVMYLKLSPGARSRLPPSPAPARGSSSSVRTRSSPRLPATHAMRSSGTPAPSRSA